MCVIQKSMAKPSTTTEAQYLEVVRGGHWMWVYDNVNIHQKVRHEREGKVVVHVLLKLLM